MDEAAGAESFEKGGVDYGGFGEALGDAAVEDAGAEPGGRLRGDVSGTCMEGDRMMEDSELRTQVPQSPPQQWLQRPFSQSPMYSGYAIL